MLYVAYQAHSDFMVPVRRLADFAIKALAPAQSAATISFTRNLTAAYELIARAGLTHVRPRFDIGSVKVGNREVEVREELAGVLTAARRFAEALALVEALLRESPDDRALQVRAATLLPPEGRASTLLPPEGLA